uniref:Uncharacterized protein n=1 Tax=Arundo donax TaxID=35708 RepID=A0A0A8Z1B5_ARUDO
MVVVPVASVYEPVVPSHAFNFLTQSCTVSL